MPTPCSLGASELITSKILSKSSKGAVTIAAAGAASCCVATTLAEAAMGSRLHRGMLSLLVRGILIHRRGFDAAVLALYIHFEMYI